MPEATVWSNRDTHVQRSVSPLMLLNMIIIYISEIVKSLMDYYCQQDLFILSVLTLGPDSYCYQRNRLN